jgi:hypothetical protein
VGVAAAGGRTTEVVETGRRSHGVAANCGFHPPMRTDLVIAGIVGSFALLLGLMGFFMLDWSPFVSGLLIAVAVLADGYFLWGCVQMAKERQAGKTP